METNEKRPRAKHSDRTSNWLWIAAVAVAMLIGAGVFYFLNSSGSDETTEQGDGGGVVELPQNPSLVLVDDDGTWYVENDGNVTMSEIEVVDGSGTVVCDLGSLSPDDRAACEEASGGAGLVARGNGPQGQSVEVGPAG